MSYKLGINGPEHLCMSFHTCEYIFKSGKNKGSYCSNTAYYDVAGCFCSPHQTSMSKKLNTLVKNDCKKCNAILKSGKRKGEVCNVNVGDNSSECCGRHTSK